MIVTAKFEDDTAFTSKDLKESLAHILGDNMEFKVEPADTSPEGIIYFGLNELIAHSVLDIYFNEGKFSHAIKIDELKTETLEIVKTQLDNVIQDIISKLEGE